MNNNDTFLSENKINALVDRFKCGGKCKKTVKKACGGSSLKYQYGGPTLTRKQALDLAEVNGKDRSEARQDMRTARRSSGSKGKDRVQAGRRAAAGINVLPGFDNAAIMSPQAVVDTEMVGPSGDVVLDNNEYLKGRISRIINKLADDVQIEDEPITVDDYPMLNLKDDLILSGYGRPAVLRGQYIEPRRIVGQKPVPEIPIFLPDGRLNPANPDVQKALQRSSDGMANAVESGPEAFNDMIQEWMNSGDPRLMELAEREKKSADNFTWGALGTLGGVYAGAYLPKILGLKNMDKGAKAARALNNYENWGGEFLDDFARMGETAKKANAAKNAVNAVETAEGILGPSGGYPFYWLYKKGGLIKSKCGGSVKCKKGKKC